MLSGTRSKSKFRSNTDFSLKNEIELSVIQNNLKNRPLTEAVRKGPKKVLIKLILIFDKY